MMAVRARRKALGVTPAYKRVDTCAAEFEVRGPQTHPHACWSACMAWWPFVPALRK